MKPGLAKKKLQKIPRCIDVYNTAYEILQFY